MTMTHPHSVTEISFLALFQHHVQCWHCTAVAVISVFIARMFRTCSNISLLPGIITWRNINSELQLKWNKHIFYHKLKCRYVLSEFWHGVCKAFVWCNNWSIVLAARRPQAVIHMTLIFVSMMNTTASCMYMYARIITGLHASSELMARCVTLYRLYITRPSSLAYCHLRRFWTKH